MPPFRILINGAGVAGPALACMLLHSTTLEVSLTIVERSPELRTGGQQVELRDQGIPILRKLNLLEKGRTKTVPEEGVIFVNDKGKAIASFGVNNSGNGPQSAVSEFEILRGDMVRLLYEESLELAAKKGKDCLKYEFGKYATEITQNERVATVNFSDGSHGEYDLVVGADGLGSKTRRLMFPEEINKAAFHATGLYLCLWNMPKAEDDEKIKKAIVYQALKGRGATIRNAAPGLTQVLLVINGQTELLREAQKLSIEEQKRTWETLFEGAGWKMDRFLTGMWESDNFYMSEAGQIRASKWSKGRIVLLGDAAYCPSPIKGMGATTSMMGAYHLAGELSKHLRPSASGDGYDGLQEALAGYDKELRPFVKDTQSLPPGVPGILYPTTAFGLAVYRWILWGAWVLKIDKLFQVLSPLMTKEVKVNDYPALNLPGGQEEV